MRQLYTLVICWMNSTISFEQQAGVLGPKICISSPDLIPRTTKRWPLFKILSEEMIWK